MLQYPIVSIILSVACFIAVLLIGLLSQLMREERRDDSPFAPYSFSRFQLWLWTLVIVPLFVLNWGFVNAAHPFINETSLVLLSVSGAVTLTSGIITAVHLANRTKNSVLKVNKESKSFFFDILTDDDSQFSVARLQNFVFTIVFVTIYITYFFTNGKEYIDFQSFVYTLMGISSGTYLFAKGMYK